MRSRARKNHASRKDPAPAIKVRSPDGPSESDRENHSHTTPRQYGTKNADMVLSSDLVVHRNSTLIGGKAEFHRLASGVSHKLFEDVKLLYNSGGAEFNSVASSISQK